MNFFKISRNFFSYRTPSVAASEIIQNQKRKQKKSLRRFNHAIKKTEAVASRCFVKKAFLKFLQNSQETLMPGSFLNKAAVQACNFITRETPAQVFSCTFCETFKSILFYRTPPVTTSSKSRCFRPKLVFEVGAYIVNQLIEH